MINMSFNLKGVDGFKRTINQKIEDIEEVTHNELMEIGVSLLEDSVPLCPVDTGALRKSSKVEVNGGIIAEGTKDGNVRKIKGRVRPEEYIEVVVSYNTDYSVIQHEELSFNHPNGGQAKYLEEPFKQNIDKYIEQLRDSIKKEANKK